MGKHFGSFPGNSQACLGVVAKFLTLYFLLYSGLCVSVRVLGRSRRVVHRITFE